MERKHIIKITVASLLLAAVLAGGCMGGKGCSCRPGEDKQAEATGSPVDIDPTGEVTAGPTWLVTAIPSDYPTPTPTADPFAEPTPEPSAGPTADPSAGPTWDPSNPMRASFAREAVVEAITTGSFGVASDGTVRFMGKPTTGQNLNYGRTGVIDVAANDTTTAYLTSDGKVTVTGGMQLRFGETMGWKDIVQISMGDKHLVGLKKDGTVVACGDNGKGQCNVSSWKGVLKIDAAGDMTVGVTAEGVLVTLSSDAQEAANTGIKAIDAAAAPDHFAVLRENGDVEVFTKPYKSGKSLGWSGIVKVFASEGATWGVNSAGRLFTTASFVKRTVNDVYAVSASAEHVVVLHGDGTCEGIGSNKFLRCNVSGWRLLPYVSEDKWLLGITPGTRLNGEMVHTGMSFDYTEPATGKTSRVTCVILGDVNCDGFITDADVNAVEAHISGKSTLTGAKLRAANVMRDSSKPKSIDINDLDIIKAEAKGTRTIDFYAKDDRYSGKLADARRKNPDALGYITIEGTNISYPIMYDLNWFYNDHDIDRKPVTRGSIYFYFSHPTGNIVITGHNARSSGTMFHQLHNIQNSKYKLMNFKNRLWCINTYGQTSYWEVWAMYEEGRFPKASDSSQYFNTCWPNGFDSKTDAEKQKWIDYQQKKNQLGFTINVSVKDRFMTISTCGDSHSDSAYGARLYFFLRLVGSD